VADTGTYLYAVSGAAGANYQLVVKGLTGVAGTALRAVEHAGLVAYVSTVPLEEFGEEPLRRSLEDLDWLGRTARAHHRVVEAVAEAGATAPVRLVTVYRSENHVRDMLERRHDDFVTGLARVAGRSEWGVKAYVDPTAAPSSPDEVGEELTTGPGTDYLRRRKAKLRSREDAWRAAAARADRIHATLTTVAVASQRHRPQDPQLSGRDDWMVLNGAYLVDDDRRDEFAALLDGLRGPGIEIQLTGPWVPYSFTTLGSDPSERGEVDGG
jgi:hypothetical protein